jgi:drug/metabolite transporter (DMT)-like permease
MSSVAENEASRDLVGYALVGVSIGMTAANACLAKIIITDGELGAMRLTEARSLGSALLLFAVLVCFRRHVVRPSRAVLPSLAVFGVIAIGLGQLFYYTAIELVDVGVALVIVYLASVVVAVWARVVKGDPLSARLWLAVGCGLGGLSLVVGMWGGVRLDTVGTAAALAAAITYGTYVISAGEGMSRGGDPFAFVAWGFALATVFWSVVQPWWSFPLEVMHHAVPLTGDAQGLTAPVWLLVGASIVIGTVIPFVLYVASLRYLKPTRVIMVAMLEPAIAAVIALAWLGEELRTEQLVGGCCILLAIALAHSSTAQVRAS